MAYSTLSDVLLQLGDEELKQLTDDYDTGSLASEVVDRAIADADAEVDGYLSGLYTTPLSPVPAFVRKMSVDLAIYNLYSRRVDTLPDIRRERADNTRGYLMQLVHGLIDPGWT